MKNSHQSLSYGVHDTPEAISLGLSVLSIAICTLFSVFFLYSFFITEEYTNLTLIFSIAAFALPILSRKTAVCLFLFLLPVFGNRPGSYQAFMLLVISASLNMGFLTSFLINFRKLRSKINFNNPILFLSTLYLLVSALSLSSLPLDDILNDFRSQLTSWLDFSALPYVIVDKVGSREETLLYPYISFIWTAFSYNFMLACIVVCSENKKNISLIFQSILYGMLLCLSFGLLDYYELISLKKLRALDPVVNPGGVQFRLQSFFGHSGWFAEYLTLCIPFSMLILTLGLSFKLRLSLIIFILMIGEVSLILSFQRGGWISYPLTLLVIWAAVYAYRKLELSEDSFFNAVKSSFVKVLISIPLTLILTLGIFIGLNRAGLVKTDESAILSRYVDRFEDITKSSDRTEFMHAGFKLGTLYPFLGGGSESFAYQFNKEFNTPGGRFYKELNLPLYGSSHNVYMQIFSGKGIAGLLLLLSIVGYSITSAIKLVFYDDRPEIADKIYLLIIVCFSFAFLIYGNVQELFYVQILQYLLFAVLGVSASLQYNYLDLSLKYRWSIMIGIAALITAHFLWLNYKTIPTPADYYGCYNSEADSKGKRFSWCSVNSRQQMKITKDGDLFKATLVIETGHQKVRNIKSRFQVLISGKSVYERDVNPMSKYNVEFTIPAELAKNLIERGGFTFIDAELKSNNYFIPARDLPDSRDSRVLAYKIYS